MSERMSQYGSLVKFILRDRRIPRRHATSPSADLTWTDLGSNPGLCGENPATMADQISTLFHKTKLWPHSVYIDCRSAHYGDANVSPTYHFEVNLL